MTTTIANANLTVTVTEAVTLNGYNQGSSNSLTIASINEVVKRIVTVSATETGLLSFSAASSTAVAATAATTYLAGHFDQANVRYIRVTNKDDTNYVSLRFRSLGGHEFAVKVAAANSFIYCCETATGAGTVATMDANTAALTVAFDNLADITAAADTAAVDLEVFVASV
jgi:hypothetical protein|tara:strand:+ start:1154 stop:1663 length:510 start_codon:yes stop_codon:yes gene_type:complete